MKIAFGYPFGNIESQFHHSLVGLLMGELNAPEEARLLGSIFPQPGCYVSMNRNRIAVKFLDPACTDDYLLMIDTDIEFPTNILYQFKDLIDEIPEPETPKIIAGRANIGSGLPVFYDNSSIGFHEHHVQPFAGLKEFTRVGTGIILIHRFALQVIYNKYGANIFTHLVVDDHGLPREVGDDFSFCERAKDCGFKIFGAWSIFGLHYKMQPIRSNYPELESVVIK
jgi:hypothetical protein